MGQNDTFKAEQSRRFIDAFLNHAHRQAAEYRADVEAMKQGRLTREELRKRYRPNGRPPVRHEEPDCDNMDDWLKQQLQKADEMAADLQAYREGKLSRADLVRKRTMPYWDKLLGDDWRDQQLSEADVERAKSYSDDDLVKIYSLTRRGLK